MASQGETRDPRAVATWVKQVSPRAHPLLPPPGHRPALLSSTQPLRRDRPQAERYLAPASA